MSYPQQWARRFTGQGEDRRPGQPHPYDRPAPPIRDRITGAFIVAQATSDIGGDEWNYARHKLEGFNVLYNVSLRAYNAVCPDTANIYLEQEIGANAVIPLVAGKVNENMWLCMNYPSGLPLEGTWYIAGRMYRSTVNAANYHQLEVMYEHLEQGRGQ